jgi:hypothetical protein
LHGSFHSRLRIGGYPLRVNVCTEFPGTVQVGAGTLQSSLHGFDYAKEPMGLGKVRAELEGGMEPCHGLSQVRAVPQAACLVVEGNG